MYMCECSFVLSPPLAWIGHTLRCPHGTTTAMRLSPTGIVASPRRRCGKTARWLLSRRNSMHCSRPRRVRRAIANGPILALAWRLQPQILYGFALPATARTTTSERLSAGGVGRSERKECTRLKKTQTTPLQLLPQSLHLPHGRPSLCLRSHLDPSTNHG